jgi:hypothetical protein
VYSLADIEKYRRWGGLSEEDAKKSSLAMVAYRTEAERNSVRTEYMYAYGRGKYTIEQFATLLKEIKTADEAIPLWVQRAELYKERLLKPAMDTEGKLISSSEALTAFKIGLLDELKTRYALGRLEWTQARIDLAIQKAKHDLIPVEPVIEEVTPRQLTATQMRSLFLKGLINDEFMLSVFIESGYLPDDAKLLTDLYTAVEEAVTTLKPFSNAVAADLYYFGIFNEDDVAFNYQLQDYDESQAWLLTLLTTLQQEFPILKKEYEEGAIDKVDLRNYLIGYGLDPDEATRVTLKVTEELQVKRLASEKDLTKAEIIKGVKNNVFSFGQGVELLVDLGYDSDEAQYLLILNKVVVAGDPDSYLEMKMVTEAYKKARGEKSITIPEQAFQIEKQMKETRTELDKERGLGVNETKIAELALKLNELEGRLKTVLAKTP